METLAQDLDKQATITVSGSAEIRVPPNEVVISIEVQKLNKDLPTAKKMNDETVAKILDLTRRFAVQKENVQTNYITVDMLYDVATEYGKRLYDADGVEKRVFRGYNVSKTVIVRLTEISRFEDFFAELVKTGLSEVKNVTFGTSKLRENRDKAREQAMKAAKEKATAMAAAIGQGIGKAVKITEHSPTYSGFQAQQNVMNFSGNGSGTSEYEGSETFAPGTIKVTAQVSVTFLLQ
ncbi:MAG: SIMPL domain-containing protein [Candidatus Kapabacteria bacterium]|jgi:hypothetical protein|nr:SIMPL domain-containing protein [Candidatus Kapabacteria bacterium]